MNRLVFQKNIIIDGRYPLGRITIPPSPPPSHGRFWWMAARWLPQRYATLRAKYHWASIKARARQNDHAHALSKATGSMFVTLRRRRQFISLEWFISPLNRILILLRVFIPFPRGGNGRGAPLNAFVIVRERNSSQASKLERDSKRKSFIYSNNLKN